MATFGNTTEYTGDVQAAENYVVGQKFTLSENGTATAIHVFIESPYTGAYIRLAIYDVASPNHNLMCEAGPFAVPQNTPAWIDGSVNKVLAAGDYWLVWNANVPMGMRIDGSGSNPYYKAQAYGAFPDPFAGPDTAWSYANVSIYVTYTPSGGLSIPVAMRTYRNLRS